MLELLGAVPGDPSVAHDLLVAVPEAQVLFLGLLVQAKTLETRLEDVEGEAAARRQVHPYTRQAAELLLYGMEVLKVHAAVKAAVDRARKEQEPSFIEAVTYRYKGHSMSDPATYRTKEELAEYKNQDPILILKAQMLKSNQLSEAEFEKIDAECKRISNEAAQFAKDSPQPALETLYQDVFV